jgi:hypothetical protein
VKEWNGIRPTVKGKHLRELYTDLVDKYVRTGKEKYSKQSNKHSLSVYRNRRGNYEFRHRYDEADNLVFCL